MLGSGKAIQRSDIPVKVIKGNRNFFLQNKHAFISVNLFVKKNVQNCLKLADMTPIFKKGTRTSKNDYRPVSIFPVFSSISLRTFLQNQLLDATDKSKSIWSVANRPVKSIQLSLS